MNPLGSNDDRQGCEEFHLHPSMHRAKAGCDERNPSRDLVTWVLNLIALFPHVYVNLSGYCSKIRTIFVSNILSSSEIHSMIFFVPTSHYIPGTVLGTCRVKTKAQQDIISSVKESFESYLKGQCRKRARQKAFVFKTNFSNEYMSVYMCV